MRIAVIDCGTNTFHLLVADAAPDGGMAVVHAETAPVWLAEDGFPGGMLAPAAAVRGLGVLAGFAGTLRALRPDRTVAAGTAALRRAADAAAFTDRVLAETGIRVERISGMAEARLIYYGVRMAVPLDDGPALIMDIGGGSVELAAAAGGALSAAASFELGASLVKHRLRPADPLHDADVERIRAMASGMLEPFLEGLGPVGRLVGSAGSFETFAAVSGWQEAGRDVVAGRVSADIGTAAFGRLRDLLVRSDAAARRGLRGMSPLRVDTIAVAAILATFVAERTGVERITWSAWSLKEGMWYAALHRLPLS